MIQSWLTSPSLPLIFNTNGSPSLVPRSHIHLSDSERGAFCMSMHVHDLILKMSAGCRNSDWGVSLSEKQYSENPYIKAIRLISHSSF